MKHILNISTTSKTYTTIQDELNELLKSNKCKATFFKNDIDISEPLVLDTNLILIGEYNLIFAPLKVAFKDKQLTWNLDGHDNHLLYHAVVVHPDSQ